MAFGRGVKFQQNLGFYVQGRIQKGRAELEIDLT